MNVKSKAVTRGQAEAVLAVCRKRYATEIDGFTIPADEYGPATTYPGLAPEDQPQLVENFQDDGHWAIVWEAGDFEWAYRFCSGDINEEVAGAMVEAGVDPQEAGRRAYEAAAELPTKLSEQVNIEPYYTYAVGIYPA